MCDRKSEDHILHLFSKLRVLALFTVIPTSLELPQRAHQFLIVLTNSCSPGRDTSFITDQLDCEHFQEKLKHKTALSLQSSLYLKLVNMSSL